MLDISGVCFFLCSFQKILWNHLSCAPFVLFVRISTNSHNSVNLSGVEDWKAATFRIPQNLTFGSYAPCNVGLSQRKNWQSEEKQGNLWLSVWNGCCYDRCLQKNQLVMLYKINRSTVTSRLSSWILLFGHSNYKGSKARNRRKKQEGILLWWQLYWILCEMHGATH